MSGKTQAFENSTINTARGTASPSWTPYVGFFTTNPSSDSDAGTELTSYTRGAVTFDAPSGAGPAATANSAQIEITMPAATITGVGIWDAVSGGALKLWCDITDKVFAANDIARFIAGAIDWTED